MPQNDNTNTYETINYNMFQYGFTNPEGGQSKLFTATTFYVDSVSGSDIVGDGLSPTSAWQTIRFSIESISDQYNAAGNNITLQLAPGTYTDTGTQLELREIANCPFFTILGNPGDPDSYILVDFGLKVNGTTNFVVINGLRFEHPTKNGGDFILYDNGTIGSLQNCNFSKVSAGSSTTIISTASNSLVKLSGNFSIEPGSYRNLLFSNLGSLVSSNAFFDFPSPGVIFSRVYQAQSQSTVRSRDERFTNTGNLSGAKFFVNQQSVIFSNSEDFASMPGDSDGEWGGGSASPDELLGSIVNGHTLENYWDFQVLSGTLNLDQRSFRKQAVEVSSTQQIVLPTTNLTSNYTFEVLNVASSVGNVEISDGAVLATLTPGTSQKIARINNTWEIV